MVVVNILSALKISFDWPVLEGDELLNVRWTIK